MQGADRTDRDGIDAVDAARGQRVDVRGAHIGIAGIAESLRPPLVGENEDDVGFCHNAHRRM